MYSTVSAWDDDNEGVEEDTNPHETPEREILWAAQEGNYELVLKLLDSDSSLVGARDRDGYTPLHRACYENNVQVAELLLSRGADISAKTNELWQPLHSACKWNNYDCIKLLFDYGADINAKTSGGNTPLHLSAEHSASPKTLQLLLNHPFIKAFVQNSSGETPHDIAKRSHRLNELFEVVNPHVSQI